MVYNMLNPTEVDKFKERVGTLLSKAESLQKNNPMGKMMVLDLKERQPPRTNQQNAYVWVIITYYALEIGDRKDNAEQKFKEVNKDIFFRTFINKFGKEISYYRHMNELDKEEMSEAITRWRNWCSMECGIYIPSSDDYNFMIYVERQEELNKDFL